MPHEHQWGFFLWRQPLKSTLSLVFFKMILFFCSSFVVRNESKYADIFINKNAVLYSFQTCCSSLNCFVFCKILFAYDMIACYFWTHTALKNKTCFRWTKFSNGHRIALTECWWILLVFCTLVNIIKQMMELLCRTICVQ